MWNTWAQSGSIFPACYVSLPECNVKRWEGSPILLSHTWRIIPFSKWLITMVSKSPKNRVIPLPNGRFMAYKWGLLTTYESWDDPPSSRLSSSPWPWFWRVEKCAATVDGWNPAFTSWGNGSLSHYLRGFIHPRSQVVSRISEPSTVAALLALKVSGTRCMNLMGLFVFNPVLVFFMGFI